MSQFEVGLTSYLLADAAIVALVFDRISPVMTFQTGTNPRIVYQRISSPRWHALTGPMQATQARFQIECYADTYAQAKELANAVRERMDGYRGFMGGTYVMSCLLQDERDDVSIDPGVDDHAERFVQLDFEITHRESRPSVPAME